MAFPLRDCPTRQHARRAGSIHGCSQSFGSGTSAGSDPRRNLSVVPGLDRAPCRSPQDRLLGPPRGVRLDVIVFLAAPYLVRRAPWLVFLALIVAPGVAVGAQLTLSWTDNATNESG